MPARSRSRERRIAIGLAWVVLAVTGCTPTPAHPMTTSTTATDASAPTTAVAPSTPASAGTAPAAVMPTGVNPANVYSEAGPNMLSPTVAGAKASVYVPSADQGGGGTVDVIDQNTMTVVSSFTAGAIAQHVVPSWDLKTLYVTASAANQLVPVDPATGRPGAPIRVPRPYNLYFTPDGTRAVVQVEQDDRIDYYDTQTWTRLKSVPSTCKGNNHADWSADGRYFIVTCEFSGDLLKIDTATGDIMTKIRLPGGAMPQDVRLTPNGSEFYVADMMSDGLWILDGKTMQVTGRIKTGVGAHGVYPSRDGRVMYVSNRGRHMGDESRPSRPGEGSVSVVDPSTNTVVATWPIPGGGSPDMGGVSADGTKLWLSGRYDAVVYVFDTTTGHVLKKIPVSPGPHGLAVWPQPGRYSLGHTGNTR